MQPSFYGVFSISQKSILLTKNKLLKHRFLLDKSKKSCKVMQDFFDSKVKTNLSISI